MAVNITAQLDKIIMGKTIGGSPVIGLPVVMQELQVLWLLEMVSSSCTQCVCWRCHSMESLVWCVELMLADELCDKHLRVRDRSWATLNSVEEGMLVVFML